MNNVEDPSAVDGLSMGASPAVAGRGSPLFTFRGADMGYAGHPVLHNVDLVIHEGSFLGIVGPNGSGKTTLAKALLGLLSPTAGQIERYFDQGGRGKSGLPPPSYVPQRQSVNLFMPVTAKQVVMYGRYTGLRVFRRPSVTDETAVETAMKMAGVNDFADRPFRDLSGGQQQRTLIARALATESPVLILDEPTNGMDLSSETEIMRLLKSYHADRGHTVIMITHLLNLVASAADSLALIGEGTVSAGHSGKMLCERRLSALYGVDVSIVKHGAKTLILPTDGGEGSDAVLC